jgi:transcriptional regulator with XRE-family HTH domain
MRANSLLTRARRLRLPIRELADKAGLDEDNVHRILRGKSDARASSLSALDQVLLAEEWSLKLYLDQMLESKERPQIDGEAA